MATQPAAAKKSQDLQTQYTTFKNTIQQLAQKVGDVEQEKDEHTAVLTTLEPLAEDRKCFRMINGVLVEMTIKDVLPSLKTNTEGLKKVEKDLKEQLLAKQKELDDWKKKNNVQIVQ
ncbi:hypothetical protein M406DRAFT_63302 [Cryphonectria parasitica EP155]|uniref:Prefoldin subunit 2 n=1 Tax=Cryphonectria parasitica (strain ATCC 38755 / EP155) TaxID=660469 RepID=A0A9P5CM09_CRYP1|nr:uncharacterized protein M406DRAFT_63302 [Cryphonectria parasitica EP155]KAF3762380.1 hypothetical protein M406DRAFT_63302 [Cryphonectria parasitica EP155]